MKKKTYITYTAKQLLQDDFFIESCLNPTVESELFWETQFDMSYAFKAEYEMARKKLFSYVFKQKELSFSTKNVLWNEIKKNSVDTKKRKSKLYWFFSTAAAAIVLFALLMDLFSIKSGFDDELTAYSKMNFSMDTIRSIQLVRPNKQTISIANDTTKLLYNKKGELTIDSKKMGNSTSVSTDETPSTSSMNHLHVPYGKRSFIELSDGTKMWINAHSRVVYPEIFTEDKREIYVDGEVYLEVAHETERPFIVKTKQMDVNVMGTTFNVSARNKESQATVVLVEGKVKIKTLEKETLLYPNEYLICSNHKIKVKEVDVNNYISWKSGKYIFDSETFDVVLERLSLYYGIEINYDDSIKEMKCSGTLNLSENLDSLLQGLGQTVPITFSENKENSIIYVTAKIDSII